MRTLARTRGLVSSVESAAPGGAADLIESSAPHSGAGAAFRLLAW